MKKLIFVLFLVLCLASVSFALELPQLDGRVTDKAALLSAQEKAELTNIIKEYEKGTSNQVAIAIIKTLEGDPLEDYSIRLAEKWKIGSKDNDNGVIILIVKDDRKIRIEVGYGLEGVLPDGLCGAIIRKEIVPAFKAGKYFEGIKSGLGGVIKATKGEYEWDKTKEETSFAASIIPVIVFFVIIGFLIKLFGFHGAAAICLSSSGFSSGSSGSSWSGGGFSGGGGSFGGGGASGGW